MAITIKEIAQAAGVSIATVSRVMNESDHPINPKTRERVLAIIKERNYSGNIYGRGLAGQSRIIGLLVGAPLSVDPGFAVAMARFIDGMKDLAAQLGYHIFLEVDENNPARKNRQALLAGVPAAGVIVVAPRKNNRQIPYLREHGVPFIIAGSRHFLECNYVDANHTFAGYKAVEHFHQLGRSKIAMLSGPVDLSLSQDMETGFRKAMDDFGLEVHAGWLPHPEWSIEGGRRCALSLLSKKRNRPDAIYAATDFLALGVLQATQELGIRVPDDLSIIGYDDHPMASSVHPKLTTFLHPDGKLAYTSLKYLIEDIIPKRDGSVLHQELFPPTLIVRESCGANSRHQIQNK